MDSKKLTLAYWDVRGHGEPIKTLLEHLQVPYEFKEYVTYEEWNAKKDSGFTDFPNLPYLVDGDKTVTESEAIHAYVCVKAGHPEMLGKDEDKVEFIQLKNVIGDIYSSITKFCYGSKTQDELRTSLENYMGSQGKYKFSGLDKILGKRVWLLGYLTYLDFILAELVERFSTMDKEIGSKVVTEYSHLQAYLLRFLDLPNVKAFRQTNRFRARPHNGDDAAWY